MDLMAGILPGLIMVLQEAEAQPPVDDTWVKVVSGVVALILVAIIIIRRKRKKKATEEEF